MVPKDPELVYHYSKQGIPTVKSVYFLLKKESRMDILSASSSLHRNIPFAVWKSIWSLEAPSKIKSFLWRASTNFLATKENLFKRKCAVLFVISIGFSHAVIESDSTQLIQFISSPLAPIPWKSEAIIHDIRCSLVSYPNISVMYVPRIANSCANWLACSVRKGRL
ncbi:hypothetical protein P3X46_007570 [Hevea brasiliensis]|uniref:Reverse transcriptase zinc-binding domain-containing protein n=1 Tax=Hevea brasiliensis TaxID=3981 RepID=A0ABQ9MXN0_HEVBR|nr:hypothetical protein P3X46_007570 [Hevea brasiliensis]